MGIRCEGYRWYGGIMKLGQPKWVQCENDAEYMIEIEQESVETLPACTHCLDEAKSINTTILSIERIG